MGLRIGQGPRIVLKCDGFYPWVNFVSTWLSGVGAGQIIVHLKESCGTAPSPDNSR